MTHEGDTTVVFRGNLLEAENRKAVLGSYGIEAYVWDEQFSKVVAPGILGRVRLVVSAVDAEAAKRVMGDPG